MNLQLMVLIVFEKNKVELEYNVWKVPYKCEKVDNNVMKIWKEDDQGKHNILLGNKIEIFLREAFLDNSEHSLYGKTVTEGVEEMIPFFEKYFKETTEELKKDSPMLNGRMFRKDFEYEV